MRRVVDLDRYSVTLNRTSAWLVKTIDQPKTGGFSSAVFAAKCVDFARLQLEVDPFKDDVRTKTLMYRL